MKMQELETSRVTESIDSTRVKEIETWFRYEYPSRLLTIQRYEYLGIPNKESRFLLELEAYNKENELRKLYGEKPLPAIKNINLI